MESLIKFLFVFLFLFTVCAAQDPLSGRFDTAIDNAQKSVTTDPAASFESLNNAERILLEARYYAALTAAKTEYQKEKYDDAKKFIILAQKYLSELAKNTASKFKAVYEYKARYGMVVISGTVQNITREDAGQIMADIQCFDKNGNVVIHTESLVTEFIKGYESKKFTVYLYEDENAELVKDIVVKIFEKASK